MSRLNKSVPPIRSSIEFARYVGLARSTVSRVLNGHPGLRPKTIERVQRAMEETGFVPNAHALFIRGKPTSTIGICVESLLIPPVVAKLAALQRRLREQGYSAFIEVIEPNLGCKVLRHFLSMRVQGVVFIGHLDGHPVSKYVAELTANSVPHLFVDHIGVPGAHIVSLDRAKGIEASIHHLLELGHRSFNLLAYSGSGLSMRVRMAAAKATLRAAGLRPVACMHCLDVFYRRENDFEYGFRVAQAFVRKQGAKLSTAFLALNDEMAIGAIHGLQAAGLRVPDDASVVGFNNQDVCVMNTPTLTSVDQCIEATIEQAAALIFSLIEQPHRSRAIVRAIPPRLIVRESTGVARTRK